MKLRELKLPEPAQFEALLNRHSFLRGNDPATADGRLLRGQRLFCSNRGRRGGCGQTFSLMLAEVLPCHTFTASLLWQLLVKLLASGSLKAAAETLRLPFAVDTAYGLRRKLREKLDLIRARLCRGRFSTPFSASVFGMSRD